MPEQIGGWSQTGDRIQPRLDELHNRIQAKLDVLHADFSSSKETFELPTRRAHGPEKIKWKDSSERCEMSLMRRTELTGSGNETQKGCWPVADFDAMQT
jgi:hypothetical protein